jgi:glycerol-3-phosphate dehydrogenase
MSSSEQPAFSADSRRQNLERLRGRELDVLILGGGINGAGIARDLMLRARASGRELRVGLVEQRHFASGTSGKNSQLIHGGLRYLKQLEIRLVREALRERATLLEVAPHLVEPLPFLIPLYSRWARIYYGTGLLLYDLLAGSRKVGHLRFLSRADVLAAEPGLAREGLVAGAIYFDCKVNSARCVLENIWDAARGGAVVANYARAEEVTAGGATVVDMFTGERFAVRARKVVDATGPWERGNAIRLVRGSHVILPRLNASENAIAFFEDAGRIIFVIPWGSAGQLSLVGTTDYDHESSPDDVAITAEEVAYLMGIVQRLYPTAGEKQPIAAYSALRALLRSSAESPTKTSREHRIWNAPDGVLHVAGGKYTTYRLMSEEAADLVARDVAPELEGKSVTAHMPLGGNTRSLLDEMRGMIPGLAARHRVAPERLGQMVSDYGVQMPRVLAYLPEEEGSLDRLRRAQIAYAVRHEMVQHLADFLFVSTYWGYEEPWTAERLVPVAGEMGRYLGWSREQVEEETEAALSQAVPARSM